MLPAFKHFTFRLKKALHDLSENSKPQHFQTTIGDGETIGKPPTNFLKRSRTNIAFDGSEQTDGGKEHGSSRNVSSCGDTNGSSSDEQT